MSGGVGGCVRMAARPASCPPHLARPGECCLRGDRGVRWAVAQSWLRLESDDRETPFIPQIFGGNIDEMVKGDELCHGW